jgi:Na+/melibiose symporter-like transporter
VFGIMGLGCQYFQVDMNPRCLRQQATQNTYYGKLPQTSEIEQEAREQACRERSRTEVGSKGDSSDGDSTLRLRSSTAVPSSGAEMLTVNSVTTPPIAPASSIWKNSNFLRFLLYFSFWALAVNLSSPFFNLYMLDTLDLDVSYVTIYNSLQAGATLLMLIVWGKLADKIGNRPILICIGILVAATPLLWLWLPLLHILAGGTWAAIDLCSNNIQLAIAPIKNQSIYFATAAAVAGASGALGTTIGSFIVQFAQFGGLLGLFALSSLFRLTALIPLLFVKEARR